MIVMIKHNIPKLPNPHNEKKAPAFSGLF